MAAPPPTLQENGGGGHEKPEVSQDPELIELLSRKTRNERVLYLRRAFRKKVQRIQDIETPFLCETYPDFAGDIIRAYLRQTIFTAKVWVNYDAACRGFYVDGRVLDCGRLVLTPSEEEHLRQLKRQNVQVNRVTLAVGTAFQTLCYITLRANSDTGEVVALCKPDTGEHLKFIDFLRGVCDVLDGFCVPDKQTGFTMDNLQQVAAMLYRDPNQENVVSNTYFRRDSTWMSLDDWGNPGWLDFDVAEERYLQQLNGN